MFIVTDYAALKFVHFSLLCLITLLSMLSTIWYNNNRQYFLFAISLFLLFFLFDLEFDIDLAKETIFKCIRKKIKHILQK